MAFDSPGIHYHGYDHEINGWDIGFEKDLKDRLLIMETKIIPQKNMFMRPLIMLAFIVTLLSCKDQSAKKTATEELFFPEVDWKLAVPSGFTLMDSTQIKAVNSKGVSAIEKTYDTTLDFTATKTLFNITKGQHNSLSATITRFDPATDGDWNEANAALKNVILETFRAQMPEAKTDTLSANEKMGGLEFQKFQMTTTYPNGVVLHTLMYSRLHKGFDYGINVSYVDEKVGEEMMEILKSSRFDP